jgi:AcrR family transcriptional regulator/chromosome segregation and condensation protein ScpB
LAVFDRAVDELAAAAGPAWTGEDEWVERVRAALIVLLGCLERDPALGKVVFLEALGAGPRVLARRAEILDRVAELIDEGRVGGPAGLPSLVAAPVAGAAFSIVHARLVEQSSGSLMELVGPVMATVVLPYRGQEVSARELARPIPELPEPAESAEGSGDVAQISQAGPNFVTTDKPATLPAEGFDLEGRSGGSSGSRVAPPIAPVRPTERTCSVLAAVGEHGGANNRQVAAGAGVDNEPQISRLLARLQEHGLVENKGGQTAGLPKAWWLTASGAEFLRTGHSLAAAGSAVARTPRAGRGKSPVRGGRRAGAARRGAKRGASEGSVLLGGMSSVEYRRVLLLRATAVAVDEHGYGAVTVAHITARAKISRRTFYELFVDREQCLLAVMADIDAQLTSELQAAELGGLPWRERVRLGLWSVLRFFDRESVLARFCVVESARGDDRMAAYREELLARVVDVFAEGAQESVSGVKSSPLTAEGVAGAVVSILNTRLSSASGRRVTRRPRTDTSPSGPLSGLLQELMALIVLPYLGSEAAQEERTCPAPVDPAPAPLPVPAAGSKQGGRYVALDTAPSPDPQLRMTYRTALVLEAIAQAPGVSNLDVARHAQINDQGQVSKLLARLDRNGLIQNTGRGHGQGAPNEWRLTPAGQKLERGIREHQEQAA